MSALTRVIEDRYANLPTGQPSRCTVRAVAVCGIGGCGYVAVRVFTARTREAAREVAVSRSRAAERKHWARVHTPR